MLKPGGRLAFSVVSTAEATISDAAEAFGGFVVESSSYAPIVEKAGFRSIECSNVTEAFHTMSLRWLAVAEELEGDLRAALGSEVFDNKLESRTDTRDAIEAGELQRLLFTATA